MLESCFGVTPPLANAGLFSQSSQSLLSPDDIAFFSFISSKMFIGVYLLDDYDEDISVSVQQSLLVGKKKFSLIGLIYCVAKCRV